MKENKDIKLLISEETDVSTPVLACVCRVTARRIQQLTEDGILERLSRGKYLLIDSVHRYLRYLDRSNEEDPEDVEIARQKKKAEASIMDSKARIMEMEAEEMERSMIPAEAVEAATEDMINFMENAISKLPEILAFPVSRAQSSPEASRIIKEAVYGTMKEIAGYRFDPSRVNRLGKGGPYGE